MQITSNKVNLQTVINTLKNARRVLLFTHINPDGDAVGSILATAILLKSQGKMAVMICDDPIPYHLQILPNWQDIVTPASFLQQYGNDYFDLSIALDASDLDRLGESGILFSKCLISVAIDHHISNQAFARYNYIDEQVAATGNLVYRLFDEWNAPITKDVATCLYAALSSDTGNFSYGNMNEEFFLQMAALMRSGLDIVSVSRQLHLIKEMSYYRLLSRVLNSMQFHCDGKLCSMCLTEKDFLQAGAGREQSEGLVNIGLYIAGVKMSFLANEENDGIKFSLRCLPPYDVSKIASEFGGGGHILAAGCTLQMPLMKAYQTMCERMKEIMCP